MFTGGLGWRGVLRNIEIYIAAFPIFSVRRIPSDPAGARARPLDVHARASFAIWYILRRQGKSPRYQGADFTLNRNSEIRLVYY